MTSKEELEQILNSPVTKAAKGCFMEIEELKEIKQDLDRLEKLEKLIDKIKNLPNCDICDANWHKGCMCLQNKLKEVLGNKWYNKPFPAYAPEEKYNYSFVNGCFQKAEKYDCEQLRYSEEELQNDK